MLLNAVQTIIRHADDADIGLNGAEGVIRRFDPRRSEGVEQSAFANIGQTDDSSFHSDFSRDSVGFEGADDSEGWAEVRWVCGRG